jgi:hypothetical protein
MNEVQSAVERESLARGFGQGECRERAIAADGFAGNMYVIGIGLSA